MRIGMILDNTFPPDPRVENEALSLIDLGHEVVLFCFKESADQPAQETIKGIEIWRIPLGKWRFKSSALAYTIPVYHWFIKRRVRQFIQAKKIEALHIHDLQVSRGVFWANRRTKLPVVQDYHEMRPEIMKFYPHMSSFWGRLLINPERWKKYEKRYLQKANRAIVVTKEAKEFYVQKYQIPAEKLFPVPNTASKRFYENPTLDSALMSRFEGKKVLLYVGDTGHRRGILTMIEALPGLIQTMPELHLVVVGRSTTDGQMRDRIAELNLKDHVTLEGWQSFELFPSYISSSWVCTCPIHRNPHHDTTYANKIFQYMAYGRPIIVSDCLAQQRVVEKYDCGVVFKDRDVEDFSTAVLLLHKDANLYATTAENGAKAIREELHWEHTGLILKDVYHGLS